jgi:hypothetical protein
VFFKAGTRRPRCTEHAGAGTPLAQIPPARRAQGDMACLLTASRLPCLPPRPSKRTTRRRQNITVPERARSRRPHRTRSPYRTHETTRPRRPSPLCPAPAPPHCRARRPGRPVRRDTHMGGMDRPVATMSIDLAAWHRSRRGSRTVDTLSRAERQRRGRSPSARMHAGHCAGIALSVSCQCSGVKGRRRFRFPVRRDSDKGHCTYDVYECSI